MLLFVLCIRRSFASAYEYLVFEALLFIKDIIYKWHIYVSSRSALRIYVPSGCLFTLHMHFLSDWKENIQIEGDKDPGGWGGMEVWGDWPIKGWCYQTVTNILGL